MFIGKVSDEDVFESIYMSKYKNSDFLESVGYDCNNNEYFYIGNDIFLKKGINNESKFSLMEIPCVNGDSSSCACIDVFPDVGKIAFCAPVYKGCQVVVCEAIWEDLENGWTLVNRVNCVPRYNCSFDSILNELSCDKIASKYSDSLRRIVEGILDLEKQREKCDLLLKKTK